MPKKPKLRQLEFKRAKLFTGRPQPRLDVIEVLYRSKWKNQGNMRHPPVHGAIVGPADALNGRLEFVRRYDDDGGFRRFVRHVLGRLGHATAPYGFSIWPVHTNSIGDVVVHHDSRQEKLWLFFFTCVLTPEP